MSAQETLPADGFRWYAVQTLSNQEGKVKKYLDKFIDIEHMRDYVKEVLMPTEVVKEVKHGRKMSRVRKFYPGYIFVHMRLYGEDSKVIHEPWNFIRNAQGVIGFVGGERPVALKKEEMDRIMGQVKASEGKEVAKVAYNVDETVKIVDGPFINLTGRVEMIDADRGRLRVAVSIFGRFAPVELEFWQVERIEE